jgi:hypothetical protein
MMVVLLLSVGIVAAVMLAMAVGVLVSRPCLRGSCGALGFLVDEDGGAPCEACPLRDSRGRALLEGASESTSRHTRPSDGRPLDGRPAAFRRH